MVDGVLVLIKNIFNVVPLVLSHVPMYAMQDTINHVLINVFKVVFVNVAMLEGHMQGVNVFQIGDVKRNCKNRMFFFVLLSEHNKKKEDISIMIFVS